MQHPIYKQARKRVRVVRLEGDARPTDPNNPSWFTADIEMDGNIIGSVEYSSASEALAGPVIRYKSRACKTRFRTFAASLPKPPGIDGKKDVTPSYLLKSLAFSRLT